MFIATLGSGLRAFLLWGFADSLASIFPFAIIFGVLGGGFPSVGTIAAADCTANKPEQAGIVWATQLFMKAVAVVIGPLLCGILYTGKSTPLTGNGAIKYGYYGFGGVEMFVGACAVGASVSSVIAAWMRSTVRS